MTTKFNTKQDNKTYEILVKEDYNYHQKLKKLDYEMYE